MPQVRTAVRTDRAGFALEATVILLVLLTLLMGAAVAGAMMVSHGAAVDYPGSRATYTAESGADHVMAQLEADIQDGSISDAELAALTPTWLIRSLDSGTPRRTRPTWPKTLRLSGPIVSMF
jgi:hypothetical protein